MIKYAKHLNNVTRIRGSYPTEPIRLNSAERTSSIPQKIWNKYIDDLRETDIRYYPDIDHTIDVIAKHADVKHSNITIGHGSDSLIKNAFEVFCSDNCNVVMPDPCFPMYDVYARMMAYNIKKVPYKNKRVDIQGIIDEINLSTSLVVLSNPNSPVGDKLNHDDIEAIIDKARQCNAVVLLDEAYIEFSTARSWQKTAPEYENVIVTRTFSKAVGAAGIRFGYAVANYDIINLLNKVKNMYEVTGPTLKWVETVINNWDMVLEYVNRINQNKIKLEWMLISRNYEVLSSECNWVHTTKTYFSPNVATKQCMLPWDERTWTRLCVPDDTQLIEELVWPK